MDKAIATLRHKGVEAFRVYLQSDLVEAELMWQTLSRLRRTEDLDVRRSVAIALLEARVRPSATASVPGEPPAAGRMPQDMPQAQVQQAATATVSLEFSPLEHRLYMACIAADMKTFNRLLNPNGLEVNKCGWLGTLLTIASFMGHTDIVRKLLCVPGIDPNLAITIGATPLYCAAQFGRCDIVRLLLDDRRIKVNLATSANATPLFIAAIEGHTEVVRQLLAAPGIHVNAPTQTNETPLWAAAENGRQEIVRLLLDAPKIDLEWRAAGETTPLFIAAQNDHPEVVDLLVRRGANVNAAIRRGTTPLNIAASTGHARVVRTLLRAPDIALDQPTEDGVTPLIVSAEHGHEGIVNRLLNRGASLTPGHATGPTALHLACFRGHTGIVRSLLQHGADPDAVWKKNGRTHTPYQLAQLGGQSKIMHVLAAAQRHTRPRATGPEPATANFGIDSSGLSTPPPERPVHTSSPVPERAVPNTSTVAEPGVAEPPTPACTQTHLPQTPALARPGSGSQAPAAPEATPQVVMTEPDSTPADASPPAASPPPIPTPAKDALRSQVIQKTNKHLIPSEDGIRLLQDIDASTDTDQLCNLHHNLAHAERKLARSQRRALQRVNVRVEPGVAPMSTPAESITFALDGRTGLNAEQAEDAIRQHLEQRYHRFASQAVNNMEFGRGKAAASHPGVLHASAGIPGVGSCCVFYTSDAKRSGEILILGIGSHIDRSTYRLAYASDQLGVTGSSLRIF